jgi:hypothetical protein
MPDEDYTYHGNNAILSNCFLQLRQLQIEINILLDYGLIFSFSSF